MGSEMCIRDRFNIYAVFDEPIERKRARVVYIDVCRTTYYVVYNAIAFYNRHCPIKFIFVQDGGVILIEIELK